MPADKWFNYTAETTEELLALEGKFRTDSLVCAFEEAIQKKAESMPLSRAEIYVLAIEGLEREVNNGGYNQFFVNPSCEFVNVIEDALRAIACPEVADITRTAVHALDLGERLSPETAQAAAEDADKKLDDMLGECDDLYYACREPIADRLFAWIKANRASISIGARATAN